MPEPEMDPRKELHRALSNVDVDQVYRLLRGQRIDVNYRDPTVGLQSALMRLCHVHVDPEDRAGIFHLLVEQGANVNLQDSSGRTALTHSCIAEKVDLIGLLSKMPDCDPNIADSDGNPPLMYAVKSRQVHVVKKLVMYFKDHGIDINHRNSKGLCALTEAESRFDGDICRVLINEGGADPSRLDVLQNQRGPRSPRSAMPETLPTSPRVSPRGRVHRQRSDPLCPLVVHGKNLLSERSASADTMPPGLADGLSSRQRSFDSCSSVSFTESESDLPEVQEEDEFEDADEVMKEYGSLLHRRRNSKSLPNLYDMPCMSAGSSPCGSPRLAADETYPHSKGRYERSYTLEEASLPRVTEDSDEDSDEDLAPSPGALSKRRGSVSLPDLRVCGTFLVGQPNSPAVSKENISDGRNKPHSHKLSPTKSKTRPATNLNMNNALTCHSLESARTPRLGLLSKRKEHKMLTASLAFPTSKDS